MADPLARPLPTPRKPAPAAVPVVRLAQLVRTPTPIAPPPRAGDVVVELGTTRITIGAGADTSTVVMVLTLLGGRA
jgi:hypothetical protein